MATLVKKSAVLIGLVCSVAGCSMLSKPDPVAIDQYLLEYQTAGGKDAAGSDAPVLLVTIPRAHGGYDTAGIAYMQQAYGLRYYTRSRWADTPARMLAPLVADAMQATGRFQALYTTPGSIAADMRLDMELIRFHQDFTRQPSEMHITLRALLIDLQENKVIASQQFDLSEPAEADDAYGGVVAANRAVGRLLDDLTRFCLANQPR